MSVNKNCKFLQFCLSAWFTLPVSQFVPELRRLGFEPLSPKAVGGAGPVGSVTRGGEWGGGMRNAQGAWRIHAQLPRLASCLSHTVPATSGPVRLGMESLGPQQAQPENLVSRNCGPPATGDKGFFRPAQSSTVLTRPGWELAARGHQCPGPALCSVTAWQMQQPLVTRACPQTGARPQRTTGDD